MLHLIQNSNLPQVLRYNDGQKYDAHWDWFDDPNSKKQSATQGNRFATVLLYLGDVEEGGETSLPLANPIDAELQKLDNASPCAAKSGLAVRPRKGSALLFFDMDPNGRDVSRAALHASCPTTKVSCPGCDNALALQCTAVLLLCRAAGLPVALHDA